MISIPTPTPIVFTDAEASMIDAAIEGTYDCAMSGEGNAGSIDWQAAIHGLWAALHPDNGQPALTPAQASVLLDMIAEGEDDDQATYDSLIGKLTDLVGSAA